MPAELWALIMTYLDEFTVWMVCRYVSKMIRAEAERDFAKTRLPAIISFNWEFHTGDGCWADDIDDLVRCHGSCELIRFCRYAEDEERTIFDILFKYRLSKSNDDDFLWPYLNPHIGNFRKDLWSAELKEAIKKDLTYSDTAHSVPKTKPLSYDHNPYPYRSRRFLYVGSHVNAVEIPGLHFDFDKQQVSFLWKRFLTDFFGEEAFVRTMRRNRGISYTESPIMEDLHEFKKLGLARSGNGPHSDARRFFQGETDIIGKSNAALYARAYRIRSDRSHLRADLENKMPAYVADNMLRRLRGVRRRQLCEMAGVRKR